MKKQLQIGDEIVSSQYGSYGEILKVTRVTPKRAFCKVNDRFERQFRLEIGDRGNLREVTSMSYLPSYWLVTDEIRAKVIEQTQIKMCGHLMGSVNPSALSPEDRATIIEILSKYKKP